MIAQPLRKKKKKASKGLLSFGDDEEEGTSIASTPAARTSRTKAGLSPDSAASISDNQATLRRLAPNPNAVLPAPKVLTKAALQAEATTRETLRREFLSLQEAVKATEIIIPFVFYDGTNIPGGTVKIKKGDHIWLFLDRCRKVGAELGVAGGGGAGGNSGSKSKNDSRREWARVGVDDLMCVRGELIIPHVSVLLTRPFTMLTNFTCSIMSFTTSLPTGPRILLRLAAFCSITRTLRHGAWREMMLSSHGHRMRISRAKITTQR